MRRGKAARRNGTNAHDRAMGLVYHLARRWEGNALSTRTVAKILRRRGIHPWSLLPAIWGQTWLLAAWDLKAPAWLTDAITLGNHGLALVRLPKGVRLPEGLLIHTLEVVDSPHLARLPRGLRCSRLAVTRCRGLVRLPSPAPGLRVLEVVDCPGLREVPEGLPSLERVILKRCVSLRRIPFSHDLKALHLSSLPALKALPARGTIGSLKVWNCRNLAELRGLQVTYRLWVHGCTGLRSLPDCAEDLRGRVRDCPGLVDPVWPRDSDDFTFEAGEGASFLLPPEPAPAGQGVGPRPLPGLAAPEGRIWPWPPEGYTRTAIPEPLALMVGGLGLGLLDRATCLAGVGRGLPWAIRALLLGTRDPAAAVRLGAELLGEAQRGRDFGAASLVCLELEGLGLGVLSAAMLLDRQVVHGLRRVLGQDWCRHFRRNHESIASLGASARVLPGPLVLGAEAACAPISDPVLETRIVECPCLTRLEGPVWAARSLWFKDCPDLEALPALLSVRGDLVVEDCPALRRFPERLEVDGDLVLARLPRLQGQVCRAKVGGAVRLDGVPGLRVDLTG